jgi:predicted small secreted protein
MKNKILFLVIVAILVLSAIVLTACNKDKGAPEIKASDLSVEFDGLPHGISATLSVAGGLSYEYVGIDNSYSSALEPTQPGKYKVTIKYTPDNMSKEKGAEKEAVLDIVLPYTISADGTEISAYTGNSKHIVIPNEYKGKQIKAVSENTYAGKDILSLKAPETEFSVNPAAFTDSVNFQKIIIHENTKLLSGQYPAGTTLEYYGKPTAIKAGAFGNVQGIDELTIPQTVTSITNGALGSMGIKKLILSSKLALGNQALSDSLVSVEVFPWEEQTTLADYFFKDCTNIQSIILRSGIIGLGEKAFYNTLALRSLVIENTIEEWGVETFKLSGLTTLKYNGAFSLSGRSVPETLVNIEVLSGITTLQEEAFWGMVHITNVTLPVTLETISASSFFGCSYLETIVLPQNLKSIGNYAFSECGSLRTIALPNSVETIGYEAFARCQSLVEINIPTSLSSLADGTFKYCELLETITIPANIRSIGEWCFNGCSLLKTIIVVSGLEEIERGAFAGTQIEELELPSTVMSIASQVFEGASKLEKLTVLSLTPPNVTEETFFGTNANLIIYVQSSALIAYENDSIWSSQTIETI